jgi:archaeosortase B (VPXXXP-CTERM-specific)
MTATAVGWSAALFGGDTRWDDCQISLGGFQIEVVDECTGILELILFLSAVLAFSSRIRSKIIGAIVGVPLVLLMNLARMVTLLYAGAHSRKLFEFLHVYMWQTSYVIFVGLLFIGWLTLVVAREKKRTPQVSA